MENKKFFISLNRPDDNYTKIFSVVVSFDMQKQHQIQRILPHVCLVISVFTAVRIEEYTLFNRTLYSTNQLFLHRSIVFSHARLILTQAHHNHNEP